MSSGSTTNKNKYAIQIIVKFRKFIDNTNATEVLKELYISSISEEGVYSVTQFESSAKKFTYEEAKEIVNKFKYNNEKICTGNGVIITSRNLEGISLK